MRNVVKILIAILVIVILVFMIVNTKIKNIEVVGSKKNSDAEIVSQIIDSENDTISLVFFVKDKLLKHKDIKFVDSYKVEWLSPVSIRIVVKEKEPIAFVKKDIKNVYFDKEGIVTDVSTDKKILPEVKGLNFKSNVLGERLELSDNKLFDDVLLIVKTLAEKNLPLELIEIDKNNEIKCYLDKTIALLGQGKNLDVKIRRLIDIYPEIKDLSGILDLSEARENMIDEQYIFKKTP